MKKVGIKNVAQTFNCSCVETACEELGWKVGKVLQWATVVWMKGIG